VADSLCSEEVKLRVCDEFDDGKGDGEGGIA